MPDEMCQSCHKVEASGLHSCPFSEEIHDNSTTLCNCCDDCTHECAMDI